MRSIIGEIEAAEARAEEIRQSAVGDAREIQAAARDEAEKSLAALDEQERKATAEALEQAQIEGEKLAKQILETMSAEADAVCEQANQKLDAAVRYLIDRVRETA